MSKTVPFSDFLENVARHLDLLIARKIFLVQAILLFDVFERRHHKSSMSLLENSANLSIETSPDGRTEVGTNGKVNIKHHDKFGTGKETRSIAPSVQLTVEGRENEVYVDVG